jgi:hypothetical protein
MEKNKYREDKKYTETGIYINNELFTGYTHINQVLVKLKN